MHRHAAAAAILCTLLAWSPCAEAGFYDKDDTSPVASFGQHYATMGGLAGPGGLDGAVGVTVTAHRRDGWLIAPMTLAFARAGVTGQFLAGTGVSLALDVGVAVDLTRVQVYAYHSAPGVGWGAFPGTSLVLQRGLGAEVRLGDELDGFSKAKGLGFTVEFRHSNWMAGPNNRSWGWAGLASVTLYIQKGGTP